VAGTSSTKAFSTSMCFQFSNVTNCVMCRSAAKLALHDHQGALADAQAALAIDQR